MTSARTATFLVPVRAEKLHDGGVAGQLLQRENVVRSCNRRGNDAVASIVMASHPHLGRPTPLTRHLLIASPGPLNAPHGSPAGSTGSFCKSHHGCGLVPRNPPLVIVASDRIDVRVRVTRATVVTRRSD
jgi:hypothetical protein